MQKRVILWISGAAAVIALGFAFLGPHSPEPVPGFTGQEVAAIKAAARRAEWRTTFNNLSLKKLAESAQKIRFACCNRITSPVAHAGGYVDVLAIIPDNMDSFVWYHLRKQEGHWVVSKRIPIVASGSKS